ncbi:uncharacterized protein LOC111897448 isoform X1 [Lactuca sativa]|uniref:BZIP domain-containing protein n=1 Tax=Lactuca sativa TaxID=4236 RepID=A0A9R1XA38_LACSA|nr:uncharacterized protein LOC111897448 isoform X1 [Lactuca sativa]KAJ0201062.1 hypothetical protein LSAT_V11C600324850 [Lactuca sativa]
MEAINGSSSENAGEDHRMLEAAEALAALSHVGESVSERVKAVSNAGNSCFDSIESSSKRPINVDKQSEKTCIWAEKPVNNEWNTELASNVSYSTKYSTLGGRRHRRTLTEAEKEARKIRRVLANRESARQTIRRRQAIYEELARKAGDLAWENKNLKRKKEMASKELDILKVTNECLKAKMIKITKMYGHTYCSSSTNSPIMMCNQSSFPPFTWPPMIVLPYPWLFPFLQNNNQNHPHFNLNEKPVESSSSPGNLLSDSKQIVHKNHQVPGVCSVKTVCDMAAAAEARKRRKNLKMEKSLFCRQRRMR